MLFFKIKMNAKYNENTRPREMIGGCVLSNLLKLGKWILENVRVNTQLSQILCGCGKFCAVTCFLSRFLIFFQDFGKCKISCPNHSNSIKDTNKTQALTKNIFMDICVVDTLNQLFTRGCYSRIKFSKK